MFDLPLDQISYVGIIAILVLTGIGLPVPEEVPIIAAGIASSVGTLHPWWAFASCLLGALGGDAVLYAIGYHFGHSLITRHPRFAHLLHADREARIEQMIRRHEFKVFFLSRFMIGVRAPVYLAAGVLRIPFHRFMLIDVFCATSVVGLFFWLSYAYGHRLTSFIRQSEIWLTATLAVVLCAGVAYFFWRRKRKRAQTREVKEVEPEACTVGADSAKEL